MKVLKYQTEIQGTEHLRIFQLENDFVEIQMGTHPMDGRPPISVVLSKQGLTDLINGLQQFWNNETE